MAGYNSREDENTNGIAFWNGACGASNPCTSNGAGSASDQIAIVLDPSNNSDCLGNDVGDNNVIVNVFSIADLDNDQISSLYCRGFNISTNTWYSNAQPLVDGVENMQVLYGVSDPLANNVITNYISADGVTTWGDIGAVRISLLINNGQAIGSGDRVTRTFNLLDAPTITATDKHSRHAFSTTITINNIIYQSGDSNQ
ncbi:MAG: PilW family protein [Paraglaciecola sp.]|nr:PilW family protein [Paraglaciecola sp.]